MKNKTGKYFKYAIGEIVLVVIGILIALSINNWNQNRINNKKQTQYLKSIAKDLTHQIKNLDYHIKEENENLQDIEKLISHYNEKKGFILNDSTLKYFGSVFDRTTYLVSRPTFTQLLSTGNIDIIHNDRIRNAIVIYYQDIERRELIVLKNNDVKDLVLNPIFIKNIDLTFKSNLKTKLLLFNDNIPLQLEQTNKNLLDEDRLFEVVNIVKLKWLSTLSSITWFEDDKQRTLNLIEQINSELENN